jgi:hypothetical protein
MGTNFAVVARQLSATFFPSNYLIHQSTVRTFINISIVFLHFLHDEFTTAIGVLVRVAILECVPESLF